MNKIYRLLTFVLMFTPLISWATHERAAEITYKHINGLTYQIKLVTYTYTPSPADRDNLQIYWGDGTSNIVPRTLKLDLPDDIRKNEYVTQHTFPGPGSYFISMEDPNRNYGVINVPNSVNVPIYVETKLIISPFLGQPNNSPVLLNPPIDKGCVGSPFVHNPGAYDPDGDSLSYKLVTCRGAQGLPIPGYFLPQAINGVSIDSVTGDFVWDSPILQGEYNIAILIEEWRNGIKIGSVIRDMQIIILTCNNTPPVIDPIPDTCVEAGVFLQIPVRATDAQGNNITLSATGGPFLANPNPAQFITTTGPSPLTVNFEWQTSCNHVRKQPYQVNVKAVDNGTPVNLVDFESFSIKVVAPAPKNLTATATGNNIALIWNKSFCQEAVGYKIYRRSGFYGYNPSHCETGVPAYTGYSLIKTQAGINDTILIDDNGGNGLTHGINYCYMVIAYFSDGAESYASNEACAALKRDVPIITHVTILETNSSMGSDSVKWSKPTELDFGQVPGPFRYLIYRGMGIAPASFQLVDSTNSINDTLWKDNLLNTQQNAYSYKIELWNVDLANRFLVGSTQKASSVFLTLTPGDKRLKLNWQFNVPWFNTEYTIYRKNPVTLLFDSVGTSISSKYTDYGLVNGQNYCYMIKAIGHYTIGNITDPLINYSQIACGEPNDQEGPCAPILTVMPSCDSMYNRLNWLLIDSCSDDIAKYQIWYKSRQSDDLQLIQTIVGRQNLSFIHLVNQSLSGCYAIIAIDSNQNAGPMSNIVCNEVDTCSAYKLPNVFTPNGDGVNDVFIPYPYKFVEKVDMKIYNRWGVLVYETTNPDINWDGKDKSSHQYCSDGVYFYVCEVFLPRLAGEYSYGIKGTITLLRGK